MTVINVDFKLLVGRQAPSKDTLFGFMQSLIEQFHSCGCERTAETYTSAMNSIARFNEGKDIRLEEMDEAMMIRYEAYLNSRGVTANTSSFYMRILRAAYNKAVETELTVQRHPFAKVYTGVRKTAKRAISLRQIRRISALDLSHSRGMEFARDMFMFSFYTRGMSLVDIAYLTCDNLDNGRLTYRRQKTGQVLSVKLEKCMLDIIERYYRPQTRYLFPLIREEGVNERMQYLNRSSWLCVKLKKVGKMAKLDIPLTMYVARHSWASIARASHIPISIISEGMGHESEQTTQIYLSSFDYMEVDKANRRILKLL